MPFTKAQRLKGLKKQLANLGYEVTKGGVQVDTVMEDLSKNGEPEARGAHTLARMRSQQDEEGF